METKKVLLFELNNEEMVVPISMVQEIVGYDMLERQEDKTALHIRGFSFPIIDLNAFCNQGTTEVTENTAVLLLIKSNGDKVAGICNMANSVIDIDIDQTTYPYLKLDDVVVVNREVAIRMLANAAFECLSDDPAIVMDYLREGVVGYEQATDEMLIEEIKDNDMLSEYRVKAGIPLMVKCDNCGHEAPENEIQRDEYDNIVCNGCYAEAKSLCLNFGELDDSIEIHDVKESLKKLFLHVNGVTTQTFPENPNLLVVNGLNRNIMAIMQELVGIGPEISRTS